MRLAEELRLVEYFVGGEWIETRLDLLTEGDRFRMFEPTTEPVRSDDGATEWVVTRRASVEVKPFIDPAYILAA